MSNNFNRKNTALSIALAGLMLGTTAFAQQAPQLTDTDGDGVISAEEIAAARDARKQEMLAQYDKDGNGELSRDERRVLKDARYDELVLQFDADGDGELSRDERQASREARRALIDQQLDVNQDGEVSGEEAAGIDELRSEKRSDKGGRNHNGGGRGGHDRGDRRG